MRKITTLMVGTPQVLISSEDIRQYLYCKRIVYFRKVLCYGSRSTAKMRKGREEHKKMMERKKELLSLYAKETEYFNLLLEDREWGMIGQIDAIDIINVENLIEIQSVDYKFIPTEEEIQNLLGIIIEIKTGKSHKNVESHHKGQVILQALLAERNLPLKIIGGKIVFTEDRSEISFPITTSDKIWIIEQVKNIYTMINTEIIPNPTPHEGKCTDCEYWPECKRS